MVFLGGKRWLNPPAFSPRPDLGWWMGFTRSPRVHQPRQADRIHQADSLNLHSFFVFFLVSIINQLYQLLSISYTGYIWLYQLEIEQFYQMVHLHVPMVFPAINLHFLHIFLLESPWASGDIRTAWNTAAVVPRASWSWVGAELSKTQRWEWFFTAPYTEGLGGS